MVQYELAADEQSRVERERSYPSNRACHPNQPVGILLNEVIIRWAKRDSMGSKACSVWHVLRNIPSADMVVAS